MQLKVHCLERLHMMMVDTLFPIRPVPKYHISFDLHFGKFVLCRKPNCRISEYLTKCKTKTKLPRNRYLVKRRAVSWWNWWCCTNLQNLDSICEADTPKHKQNNHIKSEWKKSSFHKIDIYRPKCSEFTKCINFDLVFWFQMSHLFWQSQQTHKNIEQRRTDTHSKLV